MQCGVLIRTQPSLPTPPASSTTLSPRHHPQHTIRDALRSFSLLTRHTTLQTNPTTLHAHHACTLLGTSPPLPTSHACGSVQGNKTVQHLEHQVCRWCARLQTPPSTHNNTTPAPNHPPRLAYTAVHHQDAHRSSRGVRCHFAAMHPTCQLRIREVQHSTTHLPYSKHHPGCVTCMVSPPPTTTPHFPKPALHLTAIAHHTLMDPNALLASQKHTLASKRPVCKVLQNAKTHSAKASCVDELYPRFLTGCQQAEGPRNRHKQERDKNKMHQAITS